MRIYFNLYVLYRRECNLHWHRCCFFVSKPGHRQPPLGDYLGELTNEVTGEYGEGTYITDFVCADPKYYSGKHKYKMKGFTLNYKNSQVLNFDTIEDMIVNLDSDIRWNVVNENKRIMEPHTFVRQKRNLTKWSTSVSS